MLFLIVHSTCGFHLTSVQEESDPVDDETDEDENSNGPSNTDAFSALEIAVEWYKQQGTSNNQSAVLLNCCCSRESEILQRKK
ncbi:hypothetical protein TNCV_531871 [Trichonephila clavipes]|nr:hypothetical protein TNCV_531871 [Trichonephila clavipes]